LQTLSWLGLVSGVLFVLSNAFSYLAIHLLDNVAVATGVWSGISMLVSFTFGAALEGVGSVAFAMGAFVLMLGGVAGITRTQASGHGYAASLPLVEDMLNGAPVKVGRPMDRPGACERYSAVRVV
jgi:hypothetical protein